MEEPKIPTPKPTRTENDSTIGGKSKKKKSWTMRILKWSGITLMALIILIILVPFFFKDQIIDLIKEEANANLNAEIDFGEVDLTFISTFPNLTLHINDLSVKGKGEFENVPLAQIGKTSIKLDFWKTLFGSEYQVESFKLEDPIINIQVLPNGKANYDIAIPDTTTAQEQESSKFKFSLQDYEITNGHITYDDQSSLTYIDIQQFNHSGDLTIDDVMYTLNTNSKMGALTFGYDGFNYLSNATSTINCALEIAMPEDEMRLTFKDNEAIINALKIHFDGSLLMKDDYMDMDISFATLDQTFKSILSIVPGAFTKDFDQVKTDGQLALSGSLKGKYTETSMPGFGIDLKVNNAWVQYPDLPQKLDNIALDISINRNEGPDLDNMVIDAKKIYMEFLQNKLDASLLLTSPLSDPSIQSTINSYVDLSKLNQVIPLAENEKYSGILSSDITLDGKMSAIENEDYEDFKALGNLTINDMLYESPTLVYSTKIDSLSFTFSPQQLKLDYLQSQIGESDLSVSGNLSNYMAYFLRDEELVGDLDFHSSLLNLDQLMYADPNVVVSEGSTAATEENQTGSAEVFAIPENINFKMATTIDQLIFDSLPVSKVKGDVQMASGKVHLEHLQMNAFDGSIGMTGDYEAINPQKAHINFDYDIRNMDIKQSFNYFNTIEKLAPIAQYCEGTFSTKLNMETDIDENFEPLYPSLTGEGTLSTPKVTLKSVPTLSKIADIVKLDALKQQTLSNVKLTYEFKEGKIWLDETPLKLGTIDASIAGTTSFMQELDYSMKMQIPQKAFGSNATSIVAGLLGDLGNKTGVDIKIPDIIPVDINIGGTSKKPIIKTNLKDQAQDAAGSLIDQGKQAALDKLNEEAQKILAEAQVQADKVLAETKANANKIRAEADVAAKKIEAEGKKSADKVRSEAKKSADKLKDEQYKAAQSLVDQAKNPIAKIAAEKAAEKLREKADKKIEDILAKANNEADKIEPAANKNAKKLRDEAEVKASTVENEGQKQSDNILKTANDKVEKMTNQ